MVAQRESVRLKTGVWRVRLPLIPFFLYFFIIIIKNIYKIEKQLISMFERLKKRAGGNKRAAIELSIGTIVIIVLAMSMLILGIVLIKNIFEGANDIATMTSAQLKDQVSKMFGDDKKLVVYPDSRHINVEQGKTSGFGIGIKNLLPGNSEGTEFSYEVVVSDPDIRKKCGIGERDAEDWMVTGRAESNIEIASGDFTSTKVLFEIPAGSPLCTIRYRINVKADNQIYFSEIMDVTVEAA